MKAHLVLRRELLGPDTFTQLSVRVLFWRFSITLERPRQRNDINFHIERSIGRVKTP